MAKANVKCLYCGQTFDRNSEEFVKPVSNRYAHKKCYENREKIEQEKDEVRKKAKEFLGQLYSKQKVDRQLKKYLEDGLTCENIIKALEYFYGIKDGDPAKSGGGLGIIPYIYDEALIYWTEKETIQTRIVEVDNTSVQKKKVRIKRQRIKKPVNKDFFTLD